MVKNKMSRFFMVHCVVYCLLCYTSICKTRTIGNCAAPCMQSCPPIVTHVNVVTRCLTTSKHPHKIHHLLPVQCTFLDIPCITIVYITIIINITSPTTSSTRATALSWHLGNWNSILLAVAPEAS